MTNIILEFVEKRIRKKGSKWCVVSEKGKNLGCGGSPGWAKNRLRQVEYFKHKHKSLTDEGVIAALEDGSMRVSDKELGVFVQQQRYLATRKSLINVKSTGDEVQYPSLIEDTPLDRLMFDHPERVSLHDVNVMLSGMGIDPSGITGFWWDGQKMHVGVNDLRDPWAVDTLRGAFNDVVVDEAAPSAKSNIFVHSANGLGVEEFIPKADAELMFPDVVAVAKSDEDGWISLDDLIEKAKKKKDGKKDGMSTSDPGLFTRCMTTAGAKNASNPEAYCASVHHKITGTWPGEHRKEKSSSRPMLNPGSDSWKSLEKLGAVHNEVLGIWKNSATGQYAISLGDWRSDQTSDAVKSVFGDSAEIDCEWQPQGNEWVAIEPERKHLPGQHDQQSHAGNRQSNAEYMQIESELSRQKDNKAIAIGDGKATDRKAWKAGKLADPGVKDSLKFYKQRELEAEREIAKLKDRQKDLKKEAQHVHPEWGQFIQAVIPDKGRTIGGSWNEYISPKGYRVKVHHFGGWSMQRVAPSSSVETIDGIKSWRGDNASSAAVDFLKEIYGIGYSLEELNLKHLPGEHDQAAHGNRGSEQSRSVATEKKKIKKPTKKEANVKGKTSTLEKPLKGKTLDKKTIKKITNTGAKNKRLVEFDDGKKANVPIPVLLKLAYGVGSKGLVGKFFKTKKALHENGFVSYAQANYLYNSLPNTFWDIYMSAMEGRRVWNPKTKKFLLIDKDLGDTEL